MSVSEGILRVGASGFESSDRGSNSSLPTTQPKRATSRSALRRLDPSRFHLIIVEHVRTDEPRIIDLSGEQLRELLERRREKRYFEVPFPTAVYDSLVGRSNRRTP